MSDVSVELLQQEFKALKEQYDKLEAKVTKIEERQNDFRDVTTELKGEIKQLTKTNESLENSVKELKTLLNDLASKPGKRWEHLVMTMIGGVVVGIIGYVIGKLTGK